MPRRIEETVTGCLLGTAAGDGLGLSYEGLSRQRAWKNFGPPNRFRFLFGFGMCSDDTEHTCMVAQALIASAGNPAVFERALARRLRNWVFQEPAGIGLATLRACIQLCVGFGLDHSGVFSAGNGPAMRASII